MWIYLGGVYTGLLILVLGESVREFIAASSFTQISLYGLISSILLPFSFYYIYNGISKGLETAELAGEQDG